MRVMISQPMAGIDDEEIRFKFNKLMKEFNKLHIDVVDNIWQDEPSEGAYNTEPLFYLAKSINAMGQVDAVYFADGWQNARGCVIEHEICEAYGIMILETGWLKNPTFDPYCKPFRK